MSTPVAFRDVVERIDRHGRNLSLTTFRKDGRAVATALWFVRDGEDLIVMTAPDSGKVKRLRSNTSVVIAPCDSRGGIADSAPRAHAIARLMDEAESARAHGLMARKHLTVRLIDWWDKLRRNHRAWIGIALTSN